jgi:hypothetical protein
VTQSKFAFENPRSSPAALWLVASALAAVIGLFAFFIGSGSNQFGPRFSRERGLCEEPFRLEIKPPATEGVIRYTLDGDAPTSTNGLVYAAPIPISKTTVVRAVTVLRGSKVSPVETRTFILPRSVVAQTGAGFPAVWGVNQSNPVPAAYAMKLPPGNSAENITAVEQAFRALPSLSISLPSAALFGGETGIYTHPQETGEEWERAASAEFIPVNGGAGFQIDCGLRVQGGFSRRPEESPKHSLRLVFHARYGADRLTYPLFGSEPESFATLVLRGGNNNTWLHPESVERRRADYLRDAWMRAAYGAMGHPSARDQFVHLYLNGLYWGVYDLAERPDAHFSASRFGGSKGDYDSRNAEKILSGDAAAWKELFAIVNAGVTNAAQFAEVGGRVDMPAFIDYMMLNFYGANADWDRVSNWYATRPRRPGGQWLFLVWDGERTLESVDDNRMDADDDECPTRLFQKLRANPAFRGAFAERARLNLAEGGVLGSVAGELYRQLARPLDAAIVAEAARWGYYRRDVHPYRYAPYEYYTRDEFWRPEVKRLITDYFPRRGAVLARQFQAAGLMNP